MKDISLSRHSLPALVFTSLLALTALLPFTADAQPLPGSTATSTSPYVGTASAKAMYRQYAIQERQLEKHGSADSMATPLAQIRTSRAASMVRLNPRATSTAAADTVSSTVQTEDLTLPLEDIDSSGNDIAPASLMNTGANIDPAWFPDESFICYSSNSGDGIHYHLFALPATGIDTTSSTTLAAREAQVSQMTSDAAATPLNERWPSFASASQIVYCQSTGSAATGPYSLISAPITNNSQGLPVVNQAQASIVVQASAVAGQIASVEHPVVIGNTIIFSAIINGQSAYHIFEYTVSASGPTITQLTTGADEENPSIISTPAPNSATVIVFDSTATGYPSNNVTLPLQATGVSATGQRNIFAITTSGTGAVKVTGSATASSIEPSLGFVTANQATGIGEGVHLFFSSNRIGGHYNIYDLPITISPSGSQAIVAGESPANPAIIVLTSDPQAGDTAATPEPVGGFDNLEPAAPPFKNFNAILYASARYLVNGIGDNPVSNAVLRYGETPPTTNFQGDSVDTEVQPENTPANPAGLFAADGTLAAETQTLNPTGSFEILSSHDADIDAPSLLRYNSDEIIHITTSDDIAGPDVRQPGTQQTIYFFVRLSDRQTGVGAAYLQIKDPNSIYQQDSGIEHKVFTKDASVVEPSADTLLHPNDINAFGEASNEASKLYQGFGAVGGYVSSSALPEPINMGNLRQATPNGYLTPMSYATQNDPSPNLLTSFGVGVYPGQGSSTATYYRGGPIASFASATAGATTLTVTGTDQLESIYMQRPPNGQPTFNNDGSVQTQPTAANGYELGTSLNSYDLAGCTLDLYDGLGNYVETVQVIRDAESAAGTATAPQVGTLTVTPIAGTYAAPTGTTGTGKGNALYGPPLASAAGYAVIHQVGYFDPQGQEVDAEAIQAGTGSLIDASNPANFTIPPYLPSFDDASPYSAKAAPTDPVNGNNIWVKLSPVGPDTTNGGVIYEGSWTTPKLGSDWYIDAIAYDNALGSVQNLSTDAKAVNWRIYDNIWGFSTTPFAASTTLSSGGILLVNDYMLPQKFLTQSLSNRNAPVALYGSESYLTDVDVNPQDFGNSQQMASLPDTGFTTDPNPPLPSLTLSLIYHRPSEDGFSNAPFYPNGLGVNSYTDGQQNIVGNTTPPTFPIQTASTLGNGAASIMLGNAYPSGTPVPPSQNYDIWRILCRGPVPASIINDYSPTVISQPADVTNSQPGKAVLSAPSCVIWSAPLAGEEFADSGTIADPNTQSLLETFVNGGKNGNITFQGGGRVYVEGTTVGFSTNADTNFYTGLLGANYGGQTGTNNSSTFALTGSITQSDYISHDAYINNDGDNSITLNNRVGHGNFKATLSNTSFDFLPNWVYNPPGVAALKYGGPVSATDTTSLQLAFLDPVFKTVDSRSDASFIDGGTSSIIFIDTFADAYAAPPTLGTVQDTPGEVSELFAGSGNRLSYTLFAPPAIATPISGSTATTVASGSGIVAYSSFNLESVSQNVRQVVTLLSSFGKTPPDDPSFAVDNQRSDLIHNLICFLRTGSIQGVVTVGNGTTGSGGGTITPVPDAIVSASIEDVGGVDLPDQTYTAITGSNGAFTIRGLPAGKYGLTGYKAGYSFSQTNGTGVYVHGGDIGNDDFLAQQTQPGAISVTVLDPNTNMGVDNVTVTAYEAGNYGLADDLSYPGITGASGTTTISNVPTGTYYVVATPPAGTTYSVTDYVVVGGGTNITIGTSTFTPVTVTASTTTSITIDLNAALATISGTVTNAAGAAISGATVTFTNTSSTGTSPAAVTTAADGTYSVINVPAGTYTPTATATGYMTDTLGNLTVVSGQAVAGENFTLTPPQFGTIEGAVEDADGNLVSGVTVTLTSSSSTAQSATTGNPFADASTPANSDNVEFANVEYGTYTVTAVSSLGNVVKTVTLSSADATFPTIQFPAVHAFTYPAGGAVNTLQMISAPYDYTSTGYTLSELFGYTDPKITTWEPTITQYATPGVSPADTLHLGIGYWVRFPASENLLLAGTPTASNTFTVPLAQGWNMIGEPFVGANVPVSSLQVTIGKQTYSFADAGSPQLQLIGTTLYTYVPGDTAYESITASGTINEYQGYWIHALTPVTLIFTRP